MRRCIRTAKEAAIKLVDVLLSGEYQARDKEGIAVSFQAIYGHLAKSEKERVATYFIKNFIVWSKVTNWVSRVVMAPGIDIFISLVEDVKNTQLIDSFIKELCRTGHRSVEALLPYIHRPLSQKEISLLCDYYCSGGCTGHDDPTEFFNLAIRNGHGRGFAMEIGMRVKKHIEELSHHAD